jgi:glycerol-3-phosphate cytidylyltransferase-like family protein
MDTRTKILRLTEAVALAKHSVLVMGQFNVLRAAHLRELEAAHQVADGRRTKLLVVVLTTAEEYLPLEARAELVAALRMVDYVVTADRETAERFAESLESYPVVRLEDADIRRARELQEHVQRRQT